MVAHFSFIKKCSFLHSLLEQSTTTIASHLCGTLAQGPHFCSGVPLLKPMDTPAPPQQFLGTFHCFSQNYLDSMRMSPRSSPCVPCIWIRACSVATKPSVLIGSSWEKVRLKEWHYVLVVDGTPWHNGIIAPRSPAHTDRLVLLFHSPTHSFSVLEFKTISIYHAYNKKGKIKSSSIKKKDGTKTQPGWRLRNNM